MFATQFVTFPGVDNISVLQKFRPILYRFSWLYNLSLLDVDFKRASVFLETMNRGKAIQESQQNAREKNSIEIIRMHFQ